MCSSVYAAESARNKSVIRRRTVKRCEADPGAVASSNSTNNEWLCGIDLFAKTDQTAATILPLRN
jgi:hypothetical protein